jgi:hypothetical protein
MTFLKGYRTIIFNAATILAGLGELSGLINVVAPGSEALVLLVVGFANVVLRYLTDTAVGTSGKEE